MEESFEHGKSFEWPRTNAKGNHILSQGENKQWSLFESDPIMH
jgi:hypothetical protein